jgi:hypothetical protein
MIKIILWNMKNWKAGGVGGTDHRKNGISRRNI